MIREVLKASNIYQSICMASITGRQRGISVKNLKKQFHIKNRDINSLLAFLRNYDMAENNFLDFNVYRLTSSYTSQKDNIPYNSLDEEDIEELDLDEEGIDNNTYIRITDSIMILNEKMKEEDIDFTNASFVQSIQEELEKIWRKISDVRIDNYVLIKEERAELQEDMYRKKMEWIWAVVKENIVFMQGRADTNPEKVLPLGMYYNRFLDRYVCVYQGKTDKKIKTAILDEICSLERVEDEYGDSIDFDICYYIRKIQTTRMILHVYKEGNVAKKLQKLLSDNQLTIEEGETYDVFKFMTEDAQQYMKILKSYGKSVVVIEPVYIREEIIQSTEEALEFYLNV